MGGIFTKGLSSPLFLDLWNSFTVRGNFVATTMRVSVAYILACLVYYLYQFDVIFKMDLILLYCCQPYLLYYVLYFEIQRSHVSKIFSNTSVCTPVHYTNKVRVCVSPFASQSKGWTNVKHAT